jgi:hypothetical protein
MPLEEDDRRSGPAGVNAANWRAPAFSRWAFHNIGAVLPVSDIANAPDRALSLSDAPSALDGFQLQLPGGGALDLAGFLKATATDALVILHEGRVVFETYDNGTTDRTPHILMSVTKAMTGLIAGILQRDGDLDVDAPASTYVPEVGDGGYQGATIRNLLDMRTGVILDGDQTRAYEAALSSGPDGAGPGLHAVLPHLTAQRGHGGPFSYISANTDLLGWAMERATGRSFASLVSERLWKPMGAEHPGYIVTDREGAPWCSGGLCVTARDFARVGALLLNDGRRGSDDIIPKAWIDDLHHNGDHDAWTDGEWGKTFAAISTTMSYRGGWYPVHGDDPILFAMGVHGQNLFVDRANRLVIAKLSSQPDRIDGQAIGLTHMAVPELRRCVLAATA